MMKKLASNLFLTLPLLLCFVIVCDFCFAYSAYGAISLHSMGKRDILLSVGSVGGKLNLWTKRVILLKNVRS